MSVGFWLLNSLLFISFYYDDYLLLLLLNLLLLLLLLATQFSFFPAVAGLVDKGVQRLMKLQASHY